MSLTDLNVLSALKIKMGWHQTRQNILAENVANADTPGYRARELRPPDFTEMLNGRPSGGPSMTRTNTMHIGVGASGLSSFRLDEAGDYEVSPSGNAVSLEDQMMNVAENQMDYQLATTLYSRSLGLLRTAISRR
jgi:flagellar basal-body rod protein FlgB